MKRKTIFTLIAITILFIGAVGAEYYFSLIPHLSQDKNVNTTADPLFGWKFPVAKFPSTGSNSNPFAYSDIRDPGGIPRGLPVRLKIPIISVDSAIEDALITSDGRMDVPAGTVDVAWFALGPHPGQVGSAVIGGHYGIQSQTPFVFYDLDKLKIGNMVYIIDDKGSTLAFIVRSISSFDRNVDATAVFTSSDGLAHLNLITCEGIWNQVNGNYPERLVIFTDLVSTGGVVPENPISIIPKRSTSTTAITLDQSLNIGASGADVIVLQTFLEQRGLLELPQGVANGFFGTLTSAALRKYQTSVGLPSVGVFGPRTRARFNSEITNSFTFPDTGIVSVSSTIVSPRTLIQFAGSLYGTLLDGFITSILLISIVFMAFKIIRR